MCEENQTQVTQIHILGFRGLYKYKTLLFIVFLLTYTLILAGNFLIILLVSTMDHLKTPMFFFLKHLSIADVLLTTSVVPMMLHIILFEGGTLPLWVCILQLHLFGIFGFVQCFIIAIMSYDRYLAICHPLQYSSLMGPDLCLRLVIGSWSLVIVLIFCEFVVVIQFNFCGFNSVDHFFCDFVPTITLATSDISLLTMEDFIISILIVFFPFVFIILSYFSIFFTLLKISSVKSIRKAFSTCSSHLTTVCLYYGTLIAVYVAPSDDSSPEVNKYRSVLYIVVTPLINPMIYSLRNHEIKRALRKLMSHVLTNKIKNI
ncbi:olfactory receptor 11L1-like [Engystomops pustulosus]|uniref:olfactory receptor 11L1-like n=1 Tax=Engystomops pustulosus TaxID=76066 RepID=UPI003AFA2B52